MPLFTLVFAILTALSLGIVGAVLLRIGGLIVILIGIAALFGFRWLGGHAHPDLLESALLLAALQMGYLIGALTPLAERIRKGDPAPRLKAKPSDDAD